MNPADREQIRLSLLRLLDANAATTWGLNEALLLQMLRSEGWSSLTRDDVQSELSYLFDKGFAMQVGKQVSPEIRTWRITAAGRDQYAQLTA